MKINTPLRISIFLSFIILLFAIILVYFINYNVSLFYVFFIFLLFTGLLIYYIVKNFFHERIKVIYKNIYKFKGTSNIKDLDIDNVEEKAEEWANEKEEELKKRHLFSIYKDMFKLY